MESLQKKVIIGLGSILVFVTVVVIWGFYFRNDNKEQDGSKTVEIVEESISSDIEEVKDNSGITAELGDVIISAPVTEYKATPVAENTELDSDFEQEDERPTPQPTPKPEDINKPIELPFAPFG